MNKKAIYILLVLLVATGIFFAIKKNKDEAGAAKEVTFEKSARRTIVETVTASGKIYAEEEVKISSDVSGEIVSLPVKEGQYVEKGQLLCKIQPETYQALLEQAEANYNNSVATLKNSQASASNAQARLKQAEAQAENSELSYNRTKDLFDKKSVSKAEFEQAYTAYRTAQAELEAAKETVKGAQFSIEGAQAAIKGAQAAIRDARSNLNKTAIYAPMSGIISLLNVELGEKVVGTLQMTGTEIMRITNFGGMEVRVDVSENEIIKVKNGDTADVEVDAYVGRKFKGIVTQVANTSKGSSSLTTDQSTNFVVKVLILPESYTDLETADKRPFLPGMSATVDIRTRIKENAISIPIQAVVVRQDEEDDVKKDNEQEIVFVNENGIAKMINVTTGIQDDTYIEIISGIKEGQNVISGPYNLVAKTLKNGDKVVAQKKEKTKSE